MPRGPDTVPVLSASGRRVQGGSDSVYQYSIYTVPLLWNQERMEKYLVSIAGKWSASLDQDECHVHHIGGRGPSHEVSPRAFKEVVSVMLAKVV